MVTGEPMTILKRVRSLLRAGRPVFRKLELHVAHGCNLSCESCSHYSNHAHSGIVSLEDADHWMALWSNRVSVKRFALLGGTFVGEGALLRFYVLHCVALPLVIAVLMAVHFWRVRKDGGISGPL